MTAVRKLVTNRAAACLMAVGSMPWVGWGKILRPCEMVMVSVLHQGHAWEGRAPIALQQPVQPGCTQATPSRTGHVLTLTQQACKGASRLTQRYDHDFNPMHARTVPHIGLFPGIQDVDIRPRCFLPGPAAFMRQRHTTWQRI